jgi:hypothetical protein
MKLPVTDRTYMRSCAAALRNCLSYECAPLACPVRKCRRDGFCAGPLVCEDSDGRRRLAPADADDIAPDQGFAPICYLHIAREVKARVNKAYDATFRAFDAEPGAEVIETTRVLAARRWRRLDPGRL